mmetsp:Transcript_47402/g.107441  ORF Transcript_47402/g.107441 Transcript_47402/m.107441 type:complete len:217 (+) Transcript_47402:72-722(+)
MKTFTLISLALSSASAFQPHHPRTFHERSLRSSVAEAESPSAVLNDEAELTKVFGRLADKLLLMDVPGAGTVEMMNCCHGGCDNCDFARVFDELRAGRAKWIANYVYIEHIDGRSHAPPWVEAIFGGPDGEVDCAEFTERLGAMPYQMTLPPPAKKVSKDEPPSEETSAALFQLLAEGQDKLSAKIMAASMARITGEEFGSMWRDFKAGFMASAAF